MNLFGLIEDVNAALGRGPILSVAATKGGPGKTTFATNLAGRLAGAGCDVLLADLDSQRSASVWGSLRRGTELPQVPTISLSGRSVAQELLDKAPRYQVVIVDVGGKDAPELRGAVVVSDLVVMPSQVSIYDLTAAGDMAEILESATALRNRPLPALVVLNSVSTHPRQSQTTAAKDYLADAKARQATGMDLLLEAKSYLSTREAFRRSAAGGETVFEYKPADPAAKREMKVVIEEILSRLHESVIGEARREGTE